VLLTNRFREEKPVRRPKLGPHHGPLVDGELVAQSQVLDGELAIAAEEEGEEPKQVAESSSWDCLPDQS
jgi:hypothetical protein